MSINKGFGFIFIGESASKLSKLRDQLKSSGFHCFTSSMVDEIDQIGQQMGKVCLIFSSQGDAAKTILDLKKIVISFPLQSYLILASGASITPDIQDASNKLGVKVFLSTQGKELLKDIIAFKDSTSTDDLDITTLKFVGEEE